MIDKRHIHFTLVADAQLPFSHLANDNLQSLNLQSRQYKERTQCPIIPMFPALKNSTSALVT